LANNKKAFKTYAILLHLTKMANKQKKIEAKKPTKNPQKKPT
jgi:hypothetical protein